MKKLISYKLPLLSLLFLFFALPFVNAQTQIGGDIDGEASGDTSGRSVSMSSDGSRVAIGATGNNGGNNSNGNLTGHVRIYEEIGGIWSQIGNDIDGEAAFDLSGFSVSMSSDGSRVAIGAVGNNGSSGQVRIYEENSGNWNQIGNDIDGEAFGNSLGVSVSMSSDGSRVAIGAPLNDENGVNSGQVRIYEESGGVWTQIGSDIDGEAAGDELGRSVSMSSDGSRVAIGARFNDGNGSAAGHVRIYEESGGLWSQIGSDIDGEAAGDRSGYSVSISSDGSRVAIGARFNDGNGSAAGHVRIYEESGGLWSQIGSDIDGEAAGDLSGHSVSISSDGSRVAIGTPENNGNGSRSGHVRIYEENGGLWSQIGSDIDGEAAGDLSGYSVSMGSDGDRVAIGAIFNNGGNGLQNQSGHVRIYEILDPCGSTSLSVSATSTESDCTADNGTATATTSGGTGTITYLWSNNETTQMITNLVPGEYTVTATDENGCTAETTTTVGQAASTLTLNATSTDSDCTANNGTANATPSGGTGTITYLWSNNENTQTITNLAPGDYTVTATDINGCTAEATTTVALAPNTFSINTLSTDSDCLADNGFAALGSSSGGTGTLTYLWSNNETTQQISNLPPGDYTLTVTDANGCTAESSTTVGQTTGNLIVNMTTTDAICTANNGTATAVPSGGPEPFTYLWNTSETTATIIDLAPGIYEVTATDANGCTAESSVEVEQFNDVPVVDLEIVTPELCIEDDAIELNGGTPIGGVYSGTGVSGNTAGTIYTFDPTAVAPAGGEVTITYTFTDENGCIGTETDILFVDPICCALSIDCSNLVDENLTCLSELPAPNNALITIDDSCFSPLITSVDSDNNGGGCMGDPLIITRTYTVIDDDGDENTVDEMATCTATYTIVDNLGPNVICPAPITLECGESTDPSNTGMAEVFDNCTVDVEFSDAIATDGSLIFRTWIATDACGNVQACIQFITVGVCEFEAIDPCACINNASVIDLDANTGGDDGQFAELVAITGTDGAPIADPNLVFEVIASTGGVDAFAASPIPPAQTSGLPIPLGTQLVYNPTTMHYEIPFYHYDGTGYTMTVQQIINGIPGQVLGPISNVCAYPDPVFDPVIQELYCPDDVAVTLGGTDQNGLGVDNITFTIDGVVATELDPSTLSIGTHTVLMTFDGASGLNDGTGTIANPNQPGCIQTVQDMFEVNDTEAPQITFCPAALTVACDQSTDPADTGIITATDNCNTAPFITFDDVSTQGMGCSTFNYTITRTFTATDGVGNTSTCVQTINVADTEAPVITCLPNVTLNCFETVPSPITNAADYIAAGGTISDDCTSELSDFNVFASNDDNGGDNCPGNGKTVIRTYFIADICGNTSTCTQTFTYLESTQEPVITSVLPSCYKYCASLANPMESDISYTTDCSFDATVSITGPTQIGAENCPGTIYRYTYTVTDDCGRNSLPVTRDFIIGNNGPTIECPPFNLILECGDPNNQDYIDTHLDQITVNTSCALGFTVSTSPQDFNLISCGSATVVTFVATDACGRTATCTTTVSILDTEAPTFTAVPPSLCDEIDCSADINYWYNHWIDYMEEALEAEDACDNNVSIQAVNTPVNTDCPNGDAITVVTFVATDNCGNEAEVTGTFTVTATPNNLSVMGMTATEFGEPVESVVVTLDGPNNYLEFIETEADGLYEFESLLLGLNYQISPFLDQQPLNGVSSYDLVLISKHILEIQSLDSPYKMIAADVNRSGSITTMDLIELRKLILHIDEAFSNNTSWRFIEASHIFPEPTNPFASVFPEETFINGLTTDEQHDFVGIKIGDVNGSAVANASAGLESRNVVEGLVFTVKDQQLKAGETYNLSFQADDFEAIHGYQFSLSYDPSALEFIDLSTGDLDNLSESNFGLSKLGNGVITTSWTNKEAQSLTRAASVFKVRFIAQRDVKLSNVLAINSRYTVAEAYNADMDLMDVALRFEESDFSETAFHLYQNHPNPFGAEQTIIGFDLPEAGTAILNIYDASGRLLKRVKGDFEKGYNNIQLSNEGLKAGLLYYELVTAKHTAIRKMIYKK